MARTAGKSKTAADTENNSLDTAAAAAETAEKKPAARKSSAAKKTAAPKASSAAKKPVKKTADKKKTARKSLRPQAESEVFALDIGTRNVVGIIGHMNEAGVFCVDYVHSVPHVNRAMIDGQIEDIPEVARIAEIVKSKLEEKSGIKLSKVAIAAAGRALKTRRTELSFNIEEKDVITEEDVKSFELETALKAQDELDAEISDKSLNFYCVGHTVVQYLLDDYKIKSLVGHKGRKITVELIAAFLPSPVVESLYAVMDMDGLEVASLTLEPIAAMNVIIPPEVRLINIALVDIGAGTSDIAISQNGSIVAYAMSTVAGDEITEEIIKNYLVDFQTAEEMKLSSYRESITYKDILGFEHTVETGEFFASLFPAVGSLAENISENIVKANGQAPAAVFLVGGGSMIPNLAKVVAEKLGIPENRVAVGGKDAMKNVSVGKNKINSPEYVTPIGIGVTATYNKGYEFSAVNLNGQKIRIFDTRAVRILDLLMTAGYKSGQIIGRSGRNLTFTLNGEKQLMKGSLATAAEVTLNGAPAALEMTVKQGDNISFVPAESGENANVKISDIAGDVSARRVFIDGTEYPFGIVACVNDNRVTGDYQIQNFDNVTISEIDTLGDLMQTLPFDTSALSFYKSGKQLSIDYYLGDNDDIVTADKTFDEKAKAGRLAKAVADSIPKPEPMPVMSENILAKNEDEEKPLTEEQTAPDAEETQEEKPEEFRVVLNGKSIVLEPRPKGQPHEFIELMALADIDLDNPPPSGNMILTANGKDMGFMDIIHDGDIAVIKWADE
ncbi:MAG: pilus assembly protein PilM [Oscillospiraceae bacterium]|nr:pilus assembly protein PilM [Oscillospiraceae bacterium]